MKTLIALLILTALGGCGGDDPIRLIDPHTIRVSPQLTDTLYDNMITYKVAITLH